MGGFNMTRHSVVSRRLACAAIIAGAAGIAVPAAAQTIDLGTDSIGSVVNITGSTLAKVISQHAKLNVRARAFAGPEAWMPEVNSGRIAIGAHFMASWYTAYNHFETKLNLPNLRIIRSSRGISPLGFVVRADSNIKTVADLKGKRVAGVFSGQPVLRVLSGAAMGAYGMSYKDVSVIPAVNVVQGVAAVVDGRADAAWASPAMPQIRQAHAKIGVRFIPLAGITPEQENTIRKQAFPSVYIDKFGGARTPWLPAGTPMLTQEMYLGASTKTPDDVVKKVLEALWCAEGDLMKAHPVMRGFSNKAAVTTRPGIPYHPAAIAFYKDKGVWTKEAEAANAAVNKK
jgi:TRAP transporter TAXI family solute receptor